MRNCLAAETVCSLLCLGARSALGHVHDSDLTQVIKETPEVGKNDPKDVLKPGWARLHHDRDADQESEFWLGSEMDETDL